MKAFIVHSRPIPGFKTGEVPAILEIDGEVVLALEDPSVLWLPAGEFKMRIVKPEFLYESQEVKQLDGSKKKIMVPSIYHSHAIYLSDDRAQFAAEKIVHEQFQHVLRKTGTKFTWDQVEEKYKEIQKILL